MLWAMEWDLTHNGCIFLETRRGSGCAPHKKKLIRSELPKKIYIHKRIEIEEILGCKDR